MLAACSAAGSLLAIVRCLHCEHFFVPGQPPVARCACPAPHSMHTPPPARRCPSTRMPSIACLTVSAGCCLFGGWAWRTWLGRWTGPCQTSACSTASVSSTCGSTRCAPTLLRAWNTSLATEECVLGRVGSTAHKLPSAMPALCLRRSQRTKAGASWHSVAGCGARRRKPSPLARAAALQASFEPTSQRSVIWEPLRQVEPGLLALNPQPPGWAATGMRLSSTSFLHGAATPAGFRGRLPTHATPMSV